MDKNKYLQIKKPDSYLIGTALRSIKKFCDNLIYLSREQYSEALLGVRYSDQTSINKNVI